MTCRFALAPVVAALALAGCRWEQPAEHGVARERITVIALGEQRPVAPNAHLDGTPDEEGRARNRRVTVTIAPPRQEDAEGEASGVEEPETEPSG